MLQLVGAGVAVAAIHTAGPPYTSLVPDEPVAPARPPRLYRWLGIIALTTGAALGLFLDGLEAIMALGAGVGCWVVLRSIDNRSG
jgi:hypothetical protein